MFYIPSTWRRLMAHFLDKALISILQSPVWIAVIIDFFKTDHIRIGWPHLLYLIAVSIVYETFCLYFFSTTFGKWQWGLYVISRVKNQGANTLRCDQALVRVLVSRLSFYFGWALFALAFFKYNRTHLADWIAETQVVSKKARSSPPRIRWIMGLGLIVMITGESIQTTSMTLSALRWQQPYIYFESKKLKNLIENIELTVPPDEES